MEVTYIMEELKRLYDVKLKPLEVAYHFDDFASPLLSNSDFDGKPTVVVLGQNETEKTAFMKHLSTFQGLINFVDTPETTYDFTCDLVLLVFDPRDDNITSDEFGCVISSFLRGQEDKIRVIIKNADQVPPVNLMLYYGALMHSLGYLLKPPEKPRSYCGSFCDEPMNDESASPKHKASFEKEQADFVAELLDISNRACEHRIVKFCKRAKAAKLHAYIISELKKEIPLMTPTFKAQKMVKKNLEDVFTKVRNKYRPTASFPDIEHYRQILDDYKINKFEKLNKKMIQVVDDMLKHDIPVLFDEFNNRY